MLPSSHGAPAGRLVLALITGLALTATGAGPRHSTHTGTRAPITLTVAGCWTNKAQDAAFTKVATGFNKAQSAIKVKVIEIGDASKVLTEVSAGNPPDVYFDCSVSDLGQWAANGYILNLDPYVKSHHFDLSTLTSGARALGSYQGHTYALPLLEDMFMLLYNKKLFRQAGLDPNKPPTTAEQLLADADKLTKRGADGRLTQLGFNPTYQAGNFIGTWLPLFARTFGGALVDASGKITANCTACVAALTWETQFYTHYGATNVDRLLSSSGSAADLFESGKIAMEINGEWTPFFVAQHLPKGTLDYGVTALPHPANRPDLANYGLAGGNPGTIMKGSKNPDAAFTFLAYMETVGPTVAYANAIDNVPQLKAAINSPALNPDPIFRAFVRYAQGPGIGAFPVTPVSADYANSLTTVEQLVLHGKMTPKQGLDKVTRDLQAKLGQGL